MSDLPIQNDDKKPVPLSLEDRLGIAERDIQELSRGINTQAALLETIIIAFDRVVQKYLSLIRGAEPKEGEAPKKPE